MRSAFVPRLLLVVLSAALISTSASGQTTTQKDSTAVSLLTQMFVAAGWNPLNLPSAAIATGTITWYHGDTQDTVTYTLKVKGFDEVRVELQGATSTTTIVNGYNAAAIIPSRTIAIPSHSAFSTRAMELPFFTALMNITDPSVSLQFAGAETVDGQPTQRIELVPQPVIGDPLSPLRCRARRMTVWISTATGLPLQVAYVRIANDNPSAVARRTRQFSDWRVVKGIAIPFHQEEFLKDQHLYSLQLNSVTFNAVLTDNDFAVPAVQE